MSTTTAQAAKLPLVPSHPAPGAEIDNIVARLKALRQASLALRRREGFPSKLPSRIALKTIVDDLMSALFPNRLAERELSAANIDFYVGHTLDKALGELRRQVYREQHYIWGLGRSDTDHQRRSGAIVHGFANDLPEIRQRLEVDIESAFERAAGAATVDEVLACHPGVMALVYHRLAHRLHVLGSPLVAQIIAEVARSQTSIEIHPAARIGNGFYIAHGAGVVIGETALIGQRVTVHQGVTLRANDGDRGDGAVPSTPAQPTVEDEVLIYAGATVIGPVTIGRGAVIGGGAWVTDNVTPGSFISQAKLRSESFDAGLGI